MIDNVSDIRLFAQLIEAGGISAAARMLKSSAPAVSRRLAAIETRLGIRLITRTTRHFEPTTEGRLFYERCVFILGEIDKAEAEAASGGRTPRGDLKISAPMALGRQVIAPMIARFTEIYPDVQVQLVLSDAGLDVVDDSLDIALRVGLPVDTSVIARKLLSRRRIVCASPEYLMKFGRPNTPDDLRRHNCIRLVRASGLLDKWQFMVQGRKQEVHVSGTLSTTSSEVVREWVLAGKGIGLLSLWDLKHELVASGALQECLQDYWCDVIELYAVFVNRRHLPLRIRMFLDFIAADLETNSLIQGARSLSV